MLLASWCNLHFAINCGCSPAVQISLERMSGTEQKFRRLSLEVGTPGEGSLMDIIYWVMHCTVHQGLFSVSSIPPSPVIHYPCQTSTNHKRTIILRTCALRVWEIEITDSICAAKKNRCRLESHPNSTLFESAEALAEVAV